ncbi:MAG: Uma2 family endonuclease [Oscillatoriales cyanobacterium SM2_2_1]|nr:Uma2 family endonuclease [Oscillatoriales cyanobacterium SM2_2_1]
MLEVPEKTISPQEYLETEVRSHLRHEYKNGEISEMTGGKPNHNMIVLNLATVLNYALKRKPYRAFVTDQRLWIPDRQIYTYPDVMVIAEPLQLEEGRQDTVVNPLLIAEVLSDSTRGNDCGEKFAAYRTIATFCEYLLLEQDRVEVMHYTKQAENQWLLKEYTQPQATLSLQTIALEITVADLYDKVDLPS